jgi:hypothetical protein
MTVMTEKTVKQQLLIWVVQVSILFFTQISWRGAGNHIANMARGSVRKGNAITASFCIRRHAILRIEPWLKTWLGAFTTDAIIFRMSATFAYKDCLLKDLSATNVAHVVSLSTCLIVSASLNVSLVDSVNN